MVYCIYKIVCDELPEYVYVGSTTYFTNRKYKHKSACNNPNDKNHNVKLYTTIRANGGWDNWRAVVINECLEGTTKRQAEILEEQYRVEMKANMNMKKCFRTHEDKKEYYETHKESISEKQKEYYETHKDAILEKKKEYCENNKEKIAEEKKNYREKNKEAISEKQKEWYEANKDIILEKNKDYYETHKDIINEKHNCDCGGKFTHRYNSAHQKSKRHQNYLESL